MCINSPWWILSFYNGIKRFVPANTLRKVLVLGSTYRPELLEVVDAATLAKLLAYRGGEEDEGGGGGAQADGVTREITVKAGKAIELQLLGVPGDRVLYEFEVRSGDVEFSSSS